MAVSIQTILTFPAAILYYRAAAAPLRPNFVCLGEKIIIVIVFTYDNLAILIR